MSKLEKAKERLKSKPTDYTYSEAKALLSQLGFQEYNKGKTSGSRVKFFREKDKCKLLFHKPHPGDEMDLGDVRDLIEKLHAYGDL